MAAEEQRFIFHHRLFGHMAAFREAGYRYYFTPKDLAFHGDGGTVNTFALDEIVFDAAQDASAKKLLNPESVAMTEKKKAKSTSYLVETEPAYDLSFTDEKTHKIVNQTVIKSPNGVPFQMYFQGTSLAPASKLATGGSPAEQVCTINCCTSTLSAFYTEWKRVMHAGEANDNAAAKARRLSKNFYQYFMVTKELTNAQGAGAVACDTEARLGVRDGAQSWLADLRNMRRGDIAQAFWNGYKDSQWEELVTTKNKSGIESSSWKRVKTEPAVDADHKRQVRDFDYAGHSVFIHDVVLHEGTVYFHLLSAQGNDTATGGTRGIGLAGSGRDAYTPGDATLEAELFDKAKCYRYGKDDRSAAYSIIPELFVGRLRRPFPCWPLALDGAAAAKVPLPKAFQGAGYVANLHDDDVAYVSSTAYLTNCETAGSGFYPLGLSRAWHGGVHLTAAAGTPVHAIADGVIVAVRCAREHLSGPSRNFVLIRHQIAAAGAEKVFYSLAMHLRGEKPGDRPLEPRWLWQFDRQPKIKGYKNPNADALAQAGVVCLAYPIGAGEVIGHSAGKFLHFEIFAAQDIADDSFAGKQLLEDSDGDSLYDSKKLLALLADKGDLGSHLKALTPNPGAAQSGVVLQDEIVAFFASGCEQPRAALRALVTKHVSEWSTAARWPDLKNTEAWGYYDQTAAQALEDAQKRNAWLTDEVATWAKLPTSGVLFHYHPIAFIDWLAGRTTGGAIGPLVQKVSEILDGGPAPAATGDAQDDGSPDDDEEAAGAAEEAAVQWQIEPAANLAQLAIGTLGSDGRFTRLRREAGPWTQTGSPRKSANGLNEFVKVDGANDGWICVRSGTTRYARKLG